MCPSGCGRSLRVSARSPTLSSGGSQSCRTPGSCLPSKQSNKHCDSRCRKPRPITIASLYTSLNARGRSITSRRSRGNLPLNASNQGASSLVVPMSPISGGPTIFISWLLRHDYWWVLGQVRGLRRWLRGVIAGEWARGRTGRHHFGRRRRQSRSILWCGRHRCVWRAWRGLRLGNCCTRESTSNQ